MTVAVLAAGGRLGRMIVREAADRGHAVIAVVRDTARHRDLSTMEGVEVRQADLTDAVAVAKAVDGAAVAACAFGTRRVGEGPHVECEPAAVVSVLRRALADAGVRRLVVVGGAGGLLVDGGGMHVDSAAVPAAARPVSLAHLEAYRSLVAEPDGSVEWSYFAPAARFDRDGVRTGQFRLGTDYLLRDSEGRSVLSYADGAVAVIDEVEQNRHPRRRFHAAY